MSNTIVGSAACGTVGGYRNTVFNTEPRMPGTLFEWHIACAKAKYLKPHPLVLTKMTWNESTDSLGCAEFAYRDRTLQIDGDAFLCIRPYCRESGNPETPAGVIKTAVWWADGQIDAPE
jgi:hypothetical protein